MNQTDLMRYGGRAAGAGGAVLLFGKHFPGVGGLLLLGFAGWVAGGLLVDTMNVSTTPASLESMKGYGSMVP